MTTFLFFVAARWQAVLAFAAALGVLLWGRHQRHQGAAQRETEIRADASARQAEAMTHATNAAARVRDAEPADRDRLREKWTRP